MRVPVLPGSLTLTLGAMLSAPAAQAQAPCPGGPGAGEVIVGEQNVGGGMRVPVCAPNGAVGGASQGPIGETDREKTESARFFNAILDEGAEVLRHGEKMIADMERGKGKPGTAPSLRQGRWSFAPSAFCAAAFSSGEGLLSITGPGRNQPGVFLTFWSNAIPRPDTHRPVQIKLRQSGETQTVRAFNYYDPSMKMGGLIVAVPGISALLDNMEDRQDFTIWIGKDQVVNMEWQDGLMARDRIRDCFANGGT